MKYISVFLILYVGNAFAHDGHAHGTGEDLDKGRPPVLSGESLFQFDSKWTDQDGTPVTLIHFRGRPVVLAMIYSSCQAACPIVTSDMQRIDSALPDKTRDQVKFVLVSFDPKRDTTQKLKQFAKAHALEMKRWSLLNGSDRSVRELAAALGIKYKRESSGDFSHSNVITVLDSEGVIRHQQVGLRQDPHDSVQAITSAVAP